MGQSYRIRTELGITKTINVQLDQEFEQLEILSLKIQQEDIYTRNCADYGVLVGRVTANNGFGLPNARVSIFIPILPIDESNPIISSIYPYKSPEDKNEDGYRYNLLPYEKSYSAHAATGTLPTRLDVLTGSTAVEIFDKYYKLTAKTNESGDYMIMGVPLGNQTIVMDVDLSDIGEFSLTPQDLIRMGLATESQVAGNRFRSSNDINSLPQIINLVKTLEVSPLWGDPSVCDIAINRVDFDLRDEGNIDIQPTSVFMGSIYSTADSFRVRKGARPRDNMGNLCSLQTGPGQILAIRQTIDQDSDGYPVLETYQLEQAGNVIDGDGVWLTELPMNLDYYITNEFGEKVLSNDPTIGIPTKAKYRFKIKWTQPTTLTEQTRRPYFLVPNIREYGWSNASADPNFSISTSVKQRLAGSYYFGLDWSGYTNINAAVNCEDTFYEFEYNKVYTVAGLIDEFKNGGRGRFIGIKEIDSQDCESSVNKFPVNEGFRNFDAIYFIFAIIMQILQFVGIIVLYIYHYIAYVWNLIVSTDALQNLFNLQPRSFPPIRLPMMTYPDCQACECGNQNITNTNPPGTTPVNSSFLTPISDPTKYRDKLESVLSPNPNLNNNTDQYASIISEASATLNLYKTSPRAFKNPKSRFYTINGTSHYGVSTTLPLGVRINMFNLNYQYYNNVNRIKVTFAADSNLNYHYDNTLTVLTVPEFNNIEPGTLLTFVNPSGSTDVNYLWSGTTQGGTLINGINGTLQTNEFVMNVDYADPNNRLNNLTTSYTIPSNPSVLCVNSITVDVTALGTITYSDCNNTDITYDVTTLGVQTIYNDECITIDSLGGTAEYELINSGDTCQRYLYPSDIEYYQVLTAITISTTVVNGQTVYIIPNASDTSGFLGKVLGAVSNINIKKQLFSVNSSFSSGWVDDDNIQNGIYSFIPTYMYENFESQKILILQRGVDPYSPLLTNKYGIGTLFGTNEDDPNWTFTANTRVNVPIQKIPVGSTTTVPQHNNQDNIFFGSKFYTPGFAGSSTPGLQYSSFTTSNVGYYGALDGIPTNRTITTPYGVFNSSSYVNKSPLLLTAKGAVCKPNSTTYFSNNQSEVSYDSAEDLSGGEIVVKEYADVVTICTGNNIIGNCNEFVNGLDTIPTLYFSPILYPTLTGPNSLQITNPLKNIMRTERLPSSDRLDNATDLLGNNSLLQQNLEFAVYTIQTSGNVLYVNPGFSTGASEVSPDIGGQLASQNVLTTLSSCEKMVGLNCYSGNGVTFGVKSTCLSSPFNANPVSSGCYVLVKIPLVDLQMDIKNFTEWAYRFRFFYGLCRGVLSQSFTNGWINGSLYTFPIQVDTYFGSDNKPLPPDFVKELVYFDDKTNNFYYRSSPYLSGTTSITNPNDERFIGRPTTGLIKPTNVRNLLFPTTIINLGMKDSFYEEITYDPSNRAYIMNTLNPSSYSDTSDLVNLFVISKISQSGFLSQLISSGDNGLNQLFSRPETRIDGDLAQSFSINSEYGVIPFSPEFYSVYGNSDDPVVILATSSTGSTMGIFFSSTTVDLQNKDFITPGVINFRPTPNANAITYSYGIKSQYVPFYQWQLNQESTQNIFGSQYNNWKTNQSANINDSGIFGFNYQSLNRRNINPPTYFVGSNNTTDIYQRGYIFNVDSNGKYSYSMAGIPSSKFLVSAPFQFYFGVVKGNSALDKFKTKYSLGE